jgi:hypothetical protein
MRGERFATGRRILGQRLFGARGERRSRSEQRRER